MNNKKTAVVSGPFGNQSIYTGGINNRRIGFNSNRNIREKQCKKCGSDYMKHSLQGLCQDCLQKAEFVVREHKHIVNNVNRSPQIQGGRV